MSHRSTLLSSRTRHALLLALTCSTAGVFAACGGGGDSADGGAGDSQFVSAGGKNAGGAAGKSGAAGSAAGGTSGAGGSIDPVGGASGSHSNADIASLVLDPPTASIDVIDGASSPVTFKVKPKYTDGTTGSEITNAVWQVNPGGDIANASAAGVVSATAIRGGLAKLNATYGGKSATGDVKVNFKRTIPDATATITPDDQTHLGTASTPDAATSWLYPYDATVFPRGLLAPEFMWNGSAAGDKMAATFTGEFTTITQYFVADGSGRFTVDQSAWVQLTESGTGGAVEVKLARIDANAAVTQVMDQHWTIANGSLRGTVYFWAISPGRVLRIKPGATAPEDFMATDPVASTGCTTCHTVSANGKTLTMGNGGGVAGDSSANVFDLLNNVTVASDRGRKWASVALSPDGRFAALNSNPMFTSDPDYTGFWDVPTGAKITGSSVDGLQFDMPAFSPDGSRMVYINHDLTAQAHALMTVTTDVTGAVPITGTPQQLLAQDPDPNREMNFPSVSPDGKWAVYHRGHQDTRQGLGELYMASLETPGVELTMNAVNGNVTPSPFVDPTRDLLHNYEPNFAPIPAGGYYWVVFTSQRTYGNRLNNPAIVYDANNNPNSGVKQLWVTAIKQNPQPGEDPSHAAFWLPGQALDNLNMRAFWALDPCHPDGDSCETASQCCSGSCLGDNTCGVPPGQTCVPTGGACTTVNDCCGAPDGYTCTLGVCTEPQVDGPQ